MRALLRMGLVWVLTVFWTTSAFAQAADDVVWVQIEARPSLSQGLARAQAYAAQIEDVNGFALPGGWYAIAVGPYLRRDAEQVLRVYRNDGIIPSDSYIAFSNGYAQQFFPAGANLLNRGVIQAPDQIVPQQTVQTPEEQPAPPPEPADETPAEARRSEQLLTREEREDIQVALKWAGFYNAAIDGAFGRGTRGSMAAWQGENGFEVTGILTTRQRAELFKQYNAVLDGLGMRLVRDAKAGIEMQIPTDVVSADGYDYPFARYTPASDLGARVLLISQAGDQTSLVGLYNVMQTLEIVPLDGERQQRGRSFLLIGKDDKIVSHTEAELQNGEIKGFTLIWPAGDEERRTRVLEEMRTSFQRIDGLLDPAQSDADAQAIDLVAGLQIRTPRFSRSGFFVNDQGAVVTTLSAVQNCGRITLDEDTDADVVITDAALGLAVLAPKTPVTPRGVASFATRQPRLQSQSIVSGFSYEGVLGAPTMTFGTISDLSGLGGDPTITRLAVSALDGDAGGPVFDETGGVIGVLQTKDISGRQLPETVGFAVKSKPIQDVLAQASIVYEDHRSNVREAPEEIMQRARDMTVLVGCWD